MYALLSAVFAALVAIFGKIGLKNIDSTLATTIRSVVMAVFLIITAFSLGKFNFLNTLDNKALIFIPLSGISGAISWLFYFLAIKLGPVTAVAAIDRTSIVFVFVLSVLFLSESLTVLKSIGALAIVAGAILMAI
jgi:transporter family protein